MKFFKSKKKMSTADVAEKVSQAVEKSAEMSSELRDELEATVVPELKEGEGKKPRKSFTIRKAAKKEAADEAEAKIELKEGEKVKEAEANAEDDAPISILEELGAFDYNDSQFALAYGICNQKALGMPTDQKVLLMRWLGDEGTGWFAMPPLFNQVIMRKLYDRKSEEDIDFLLKEFGHAPND